jgi:hypothetical protein
MEVMSVKSALKIEIRFASLLTFEEARDFQKRIRDLNKLEELPLISENSKTRRIWIYYHSNGNKVPCYEVQELNLEGKILGKTRYFSPEDLR